VDVSFFFLDLERLAAPGGIEYLSAAPSNKKPPATMSRGAVISLILGRLPAGRNISERFRAKRVPVRVTKTHQQKISCSVRR
jgi:hypothetical protein